MSAVTWCSSWSLSTDVDDDSTVQLLSESNASISLQPFRLICPKVDVSVPCQLSLLWTQQPLCCAQLQLQVQCSARHVELYAEGTRCNLLGEQQKGEVYLGTFRGTKQSSEPQLFAMSPFLKSDQDCTVLKSLQALRIKFVSLIGDKRVLYLQEFRCMYVRTEPVAEVSSSTAGLTAKIAEFGLDEGSDAAPDVRVFLKGFQETLEREMETKIARVIDAKMSTLTQRLALSEQAILRLHKKMNTKEADVQESLNQIQQKLLQLEVQLSLFSVAKEAEQKKKNDLD